MKRVLVLAAVVVLLLSGCVEKKPLQTEDTQQETTQDSPQEPQPQETQANEPQPQPQEQTGSTEETLEEIGNLLEDLRDSDFEDIEFEE